MGLGNWIEWDFVSKTILLLAAMVAMVLPSSAAVKKKPARKHSHTSAVSRRTTKSSKTARSAKTAKTTKSRSSKSKLAATHRRSFQQAPTPERYKEIQQALIAKGYLRGEASGQWDTESTDALKRFQADQNLTPDGKLSSLSLIALGLGPKRLSAQTHAEPAGDGPKADIQR